jgi:hypothetical protein
VDDLQALLDAIDEAGNDRTLKEVAINENDPFEQDFAKTLEYSVPNMPIVITSMSVIKY